VVINSFEVFIELYDRFLDDLVTLSRDGIRCGITFVLTCSRAAGVSYRLLPNFKQKLTLKLNNTDEYLSVVGSLQGVVVPDAFERGLVKLDALYEFQGARVSADESDREAIRALIHTSLALSAGDPYGRAAAIPSLPEYVTMAAFHSLGLAPGRTAVPLGISKEGIAPVTFDFVRSSVLLVMGENEELEARFLPGLIEALAFVKKGDVEAGEVVVLDPDLLLTGSLGGGAEHLWEREQINSFVHAWMQGELAEGCFVILVSLKAVMGALADGEKTEFEAYLKGGDYRDIAGMVVSGAPSRFSTFSYEQWFRELTSSGNGIWLGDGINSQTILKLSGIVPSSQASQPDDFAWYVARGAPTLIKYLTAEGGK
jgi:S-DNA-T family DNA segregation ATPase FtsK/SpoIIIE